MRRKLISNQNITYNKVSMFVWIAICCFTLATNSSSAQQTTKTPDIPLTEYKINQWTADDGLISNILLSVDQDESGYLWISSFDGLIQFDGINFKIFNSNNTNNLKANRILEFLIDNENNIWIGTELGLVLFKDQKFINLSQTDYSFFITSLMMDENANKLWIGTREKGAYTYDIINKTYEKIENKLLEETSITAIIKDKKDRIWMSTEKHGLFFLSNKEWKNVTEIKNKIITAIQDLQLIDDVLYINGSFGLFTYEKNSFSEIKEFKDYDVNKVMKDNNDNLWILTTSKGIFRKTKDGNIFENLSITNGLPVNFITDAFIDNKNNLWLASYGGGLIAMRNSQFQNYTFKNGKTQDPIKIVYKTNENEYLVGGTSGKVYVLKNGHSGTSKIKYNLNKQIYDFYKDGNNNIWVGSYQGLLRIWPDGREKLYTTDNSNLPSNFIRLFYKDTKNNLWIGTRTHGLIKMKYDNISEKIDFETIQKEKGKLNSNFIMSLDEDKSGNLIIGTNSGGINIMDSLGNFRYISSENGLNNNVIFNTYCDESNVIWVVGTRDIYRLENENLFSFSLNKSFPNITAFDIIEDQLGYFWITSSQGVIRVKKEQLNENSHNQNTLINWRIYDKHDGLLGSQCTSSTRIVIDSNGIISIPASSGVLSINSNRITINETTPLPIINTLLIDGEKYNTNSEHNVPSSKQRFVFSFTAPSLHFANKIGFKYKLENFDQQWIDVGANREAVYTSLPSGQYEFKVIVSNEDGIWSKEPAILKFEVLPYYYETWWFYSIIILISTVLTYSYFTWKTLTIKKRSQLLEDKVKNRTKALELKSSENEILYELSSNLIAPIEIDLLLKSIVEGAVAVIQNAQTGSILLLNSSGHILEGKVAFGISDDQIKQLKIKVGKGQTGIAVAENRSFIENNLEEDYTLKYGLLKKDTPPIKSIIVVLLKDKDKIIGTITLDNHDKFGAFTQKDLDVLTSLAANASVAIGRARMHHQIEMAKDRLDSAYSKLKNLDEYKEAMTAMIIHDFKNSLNTVIGYSEDMPDERRLSSINQAGKFMLNMVLNILDVQKFDEATIELSLSNEHIETALADAINQVKYMLDQKSIKLIMDGNTQLFVRIDIELVTRVIVNMLSNAIKFSPANEKIHIDCQVIKDRMNFVIKDHGPGIPADKIDLVFDKFSQINSKKFGNIRSTGIGLTFCKLAIEAHKGEVGVHSEEGKGATFWFSLPLLAETEISSKAAEIELITLNTSEIIDFSSDQKKILSPYFVELQQWEVYDYSQVIEIIDRIDLEDTEIMEWKLLIKKALQHVNDKEYSSLIKL